MMLISTITVTVIFQIWTSQGLMQLDMNLLKTMQWPGTTLDAIKRRTRRLINGTLTKPMTRKVKTELYCLSLIQFLAQTLMIRWRAAKLATTTPIYFTTDKSTAINQDQIARAKTSLSGKTKTPGSTLSLWTRMELSSVTPLVRDTSTRLLSSRRKNSCSKSTALITSQ